METTIVIIAGVIIFGVLFCLIYWKPIADRIRHITQINKTGVSFEGGQKKYDSNTPQKTVEELTRSLNSQLLSELVDNIKREIAGWKLPDKDVNEVLIKHYAASQIALNFEMVYRLIFGSQLVALEFLNSQLAGQPLGVLKPFYLSAAIEYQEIYKNIPFENWLSFLKDTFLVTENNAMLFITVRGREFLTHLAKTGLNKYKSL